jgi:acyl dehydratase
MSTFTSSFAPQLGTELPSLSRRWTLEEFRERHELVYGPGRVVPQAWPERNLHSDAEAAAREGLAGPAASAPQLFSMIHRQMMMFFGRGWLAGGRMDIKMIKPVYVGDFTTAKGHVTAIGPEPDPSGDGEIQRVHCEVWVERLDGAKVLVGSASGLLRD